MRSKVLEDLQAELTGQRTVAKESILSVDIKENDISKTASVDFLEEYEIVAKFGHKLRCLPEDKQRAFENVYRELGHYIYDDFIKQVIRLERAWYDQDSDKIRMMFREIYRTLDVD